MATTSDPKYADLQACCVCLGFRDDDEYKIDVDAGASMRSILRYLRAESSSCDIRRELGNLKILTSDLIPLLKASKSDFVVFDLAIRLMVSLTQPALVCFRNEVPKDRDLYSAFMHVDSVLVDYKKPWEERSDDDRLLVERILVLIRNVLHIAPDIATERRTDEEVSVHDQLLWAMHLSGWDELLLFLANAEDERSIYAFHTLEIISLMLREQTPEQLAGAGNPSALVDPQSLVMERCRLREKEEKLADLAVYSMRHNRFGGTFELLNTKSLSERPLIYHHDVTAPVRGGVRLHPPLNSNDGGPEVDSSSAGLSIGLVNLDLDKKIRRKPRNRKPLIEREYRRRSILSVQLYLQGFCLQFLRNCYNPLMNAARGAILRHSTQANDETYYLWAMNFFMAFSRLYRFQPECLSETLSISVFNWVYTLSMGYREALFANRRGGSANQSALQGSRRLALAVAAYRQFLLCLQQMTRPSSLSSSLETVDSETAEERAARLKTQKNVAESLMSNIFYVAEYQDLYPQLLREYNEAIQSKEYLIDLVEGAHLFISLLASQEKTLKTMMISRRQRRRHLNETKRRERVARLERKKSAAAARRRARLRALETPEERSVRLARIWTPLSHSLVTALLSAEPDPLNASTVDGASEPLPQLFDPTTALDPEDMAKQLRNAIRLVHTCLQEGRGTRALAMARSMWDIWPETAPDLHAGGLEDHREEGEDDGGEEEEETKKHREQALGAGLSPPKVAEFMALRKIFLLDLADEQLEVIDASIREDEEEARKEDDDDDRDELIRRELGDSDSEGHYDVVNKESTFDLSAFVLRFAHPRVVHALTLLLANYALNPPSTNDCILRIFHRFAVKQRLPGPLFQLRLFCVFQSIISDPSAAKLEEFKEMIKFIKFILRKFFEALARNPHVAIETLFFKSTKESIEVYDGYGTYEPTRKPSTWSPELDKELDRLFEAYRYEPVPKGEDLADLLQRNLSDSNKTRRQIIMRLMYLGKVASARNLKMMTRNRGERRAITRRPRRAWGEDEVNMIQSLFLEQKGSKHALADVMDALKLEHEDEMRRMRETQTLEGGEDGEGVPQEPILRTRREVSKKLIELGLAEDPSDFGRPRRAVGLRRKKTRGQPAEEQLETIEGGVSVMKKKKWKKRAVRQRDSSPELHFDTREDFSDEERIELVVAPSEQMRDNNSDVDVGLQATAARKPTRSAYFDPDEDEDDASSDDDSDDDEPVSRNPNRSTYLDSSDATSDGHHSEAFNSRPTVSLHRPTPLIDEPAQNPPKVDGNVDAGVDNDDDDDLPKLQTRKRRKILREEEDEEDMHEFNDDFLQSEINAALLESAAGEPPTEPLSQAPQPTPPPTEPRRRTRLLESSDEEAEVEKTTD